MDVVCWDAFAKLISQDCIHNVWLCKVEEWRSCYIVMYEGLGDPPPDGINSLLLEKY